MIITGKILTLREMAPSDVSDDYLRWMNDPEVVKFLECRFERHSLSSLTNYVRQSLENPDIYLFGIFASDRNRHIGNIKLGPVNRHHSSSEVGIIIGEKSYWSRGIATEAISLLTEFAFDGLKLHKLTAGCYESNRGSFRAFKNCGFVVEGVRKEQCDFEGNRVDVILLGHVNHNPSSRSNE